jgi:hypothetical protein
VQEHAEEMRHDVHPQSELLHEQGLQSPEDLSERQMHLHPEVRRQIVRHQGWLRRLLYGLPAGQIVCQQAVRRRRLHPRLRRQELR